MFLRVQTLPIPAYFQAGMASKTLCVSLNGVPKWDFRDNPFPPIVKAGARFVFPLKRCPAKAGLRPVSGRSKTKAPASSLPGPCQSGYLS